jgi:hypothetical protein
VRDADVIVREIIQQLFASSFTLYHSLEAVKYHRWLRLRSWVALTCIC